MEIPDDLKFQRDVVATLEERELTPFDLCSWEVLLYLLEASKAWHVDLDVWNATHQAVIDAATRKAGLLDELNDCGFHRSVLSSFLD
jgi:hypothetical protein